MLAAKQLRLLFGVFFAAFVTADTGDDFSNNLFSDLAPLLALFGERVTMQFMSQSTGWADNIILAMVPLGVLTAIVGAIRVGGPSWLKAIIGRARESRAVAESELMSSTSNEVCELWNGQQIVRVMGSGPIREFIILLPEGSGESQDPEKTPVVSVRPATSGAGSSPVGADQDVRAMRLGEESDDKLDQSPDKVWREYLEKYNPTVRERIFGDRPQHRQDYSKKKQPNEEAVHQVLLPSPASTGHQDLEKGQPSLKTQEVGTGPSPEKPRESHNPMPRKVPVAVVRNTDADTPNLTLNVHNQVARGELYAVAVLGTAIQLGVLVYSAFATYSLDFLKDGNPVADYAFPCTTAGTLLLVVGMLLCAHVVESSTKETRYRPAAGREARVVWLQRSGTVNDQDFKPFAIFPRNAQPLVTTSHRASVGKQEQSGTIAEMLSRIWKHISDILGIKVEEVITVTGTTISICGFIIQFIGLRGMHWSVSVVQLGAVGLMTILRAWVRRNLAETPKALPLVSGHELDWLAMTLGRDHAKAPWLNLPEGYEEWSEHVRPWSEGECGWDWRIAGVEDPAKLEKLKPHGDSDRLKEPVQANDSAVQGKCSDSCSSAYRVMKIRRDLGELADWHGPASTEAISLARAIEATMDVLFDPKSLGEEFTWSLNALESVEGSDRNSILFHVKWHDGKWRAYSDEIEAALSLWLCFVDKLENNALGGKEGGQKEPPGDGNATRAQGNDRGDCPKNDAWLRKGTLSKPSLRLLGSHTVALYQDLQWWMPDGLDRVVEVECHDPANTSSPMEVDAHRVVGFASNSNSITGPYRARKSPDTVSEDASGHHAGEGSTASGILAVSSYSPLKALYAQHMFSAFMWAAAKSMVEVFPGEADIRPIETSRQSGGSAWQSFTLHNTQLSKIAQDVQNTGLGSLDEIYLAMTPPLSTENKLPRADTIIEWTRKHAKPYEQLGNWMEAGEAYIWLFQKAKAFAGQDYIITKATALLMEHLKVVTDAIDRRKARQFAEEDIQGLEELRSKLDDKLRGAGNDILARLMGLFELQGRSWDCRLVKVPKPLGDEDVTLKFTTLHKMAHANSDQIKYCIGKVDGEVNEEDILGWTPLHYAAAGRSPDALQDLLAYWANVNARDIRERTPLHYACQHDILSIIQSLLQEGAEMNIQDTDGRTPLHYAAFYGHHGVVNSLIEAGADVNVADVLGNTPLLSAVYNGRKDVVETLWEIVNTKLRDHDGRTPLHLAAIAEVGGDTERCEEVVMLLLDKLGADKEVTTKAAVDAKDKFGRTPLHWAACRGREAVVRMLLDRGATINVTDNSDCTPLHLAAGGGHEAVTRLLLDQGVAIEVKGTRYKWTPLHLATRKGHEPTVRLLLDRGALIEAVDSLDCTPLYHATNGGNEAVVTLLLDRGAAIEAKDSVTGWTPLHQAARDGHEAIVRLLLDRGATIEAKGSIDSTPLHLAARGGHEAVIRLLLDYGALVDAKNTGDETPLDEATSGGHEAVVQLLTSKMNGGSG